jgi:toxin ParE1/3/4
MWVAEDNAAAADALLAAAMVAARRLQARPKLGRVRLDLAPERYRFWSLRGFPYLLVYDAGTDPPIILRFAHHSRDLPTVLYDDVAHVVADPELDPAVGRQRGIAFGQSRLQLGASTLANPTKSRRRWS